MQSIILFVALSGCVSLHRTESGGTVQYGTQDATLMGVYGATSLIDAQGRTSAIAKGSETVPVTVTTTTRSGDRSTTETVSVGYVGPAMYGSYASGDWYGRGAAMIQDRAVRTGTYPAGGESNGGGPVSARSIAFDPDTRCPDEESTTVAERLACLQLETDTNTVAIETNPAVR